MYYKRVHPREAIKYQVGSVSGASLEATPTMIPISSSSSNNNNYQSTSDSADSPITSPITAQCHSPSDQLLNGNIVSPQQNGDPAGVLVLGGVPQLDDEPYHHMAFKQEPNVDVEHYH